MGSPGKRCGPILLWYFDRVCETHVEWGWVVDGYTLFYAIGRVLGRVEFAASAHSMAIAAAGSLLGEAILAVNSYRRNENVPDYYRKTGFWLARVAVVLGATLLPWAQGMKRFWSGPPDSV